MNQTFEFYRFWLLLKLDFSEKGKNYMLMGSLLFGLMLMLLLPIVLVNEFSQFLLLFHALALFMVVMFGGSLYTGSVFSQYSSPDTGIAGLMIPASRLEKYLSALLLNLLFIVPFSLFFLKFHLWSVDYANSRYPEGGPKYNPIPELILQYFVSLHLIIQGAVFLGSIYFKKLAYIKTITILFITSILATGINIGMAYYSTSYPSKVVTFPFSAWQIWFYKMNKSYYLDYPEPVQTLVYLFPALFLLSAWYITYIRLKEKEI